MDVKMTVAADVFAGKVTKDYNVEKGFKGQLTLSDGKNIFLYTGYDGYIKDMLVEAAKEKKDVVLVGNLRYPQRDAKTKVNILEVTGYVNGGGMVVKRGRLTSEPVLNYTQKGKQYVFFSIAANYGWGDKQETDFIACKIWGNDKEKNSAVTLAEKGTKGREILVKGKLDVGQDKDGNPFPTLVVSDYEFIGAAKTAPQAESNQATSSWDDIASKIEINEKEDEIPF